MNTEHAQSAAPVDRLVRHLPVIQSCSGCGACCRQQESPPMLLYWLTLGTDENADDEDYQRAMDLPDELKRELLTYRDRLVAGEKHPRGGVCLWLDEVTGGCRHYELRPSICREFEMGSEECHSWRREYDVV